MDEPKGSNQKPGAALGATIRERLEELFEAEKVRRGGKAVSNAEVATWMMKNGYGVQRQYLGQLRSGERDQPSLRVIEGLSKFFEVDSSVLLANTDSSDRVKSAALERALADAGVEAFAMRAEGLSGENLRTVTQLVDNLRRMQDLPPIEKD
jgi:transcriptional regulator with XRE-family HTH domain